MADATLQGSPQRQRLESVDTLRFVLAFAVIALHPAASAGPRWAHLVRTLCRGAVIAWQYDDTAPDDMSGRIITPF